MPCTCIGPGAIHSTTAWSLSPASSVHSNRFSAPASVRLISTTCARADADIASAECQSLGCDSVAMVRAIAAVRQTNGSTPV